MRIIRTRRRFCAVPRFWLAIILVVLCLVPLLVWGQKLQPEKVPDALLQEAGPAVLIHRGTCEREQKEVLCMVAIHPTTDILWMLLFNEDGVLYQVLNINSAGVETIRWTHSMLRS